jgi:Domain of Unknown Function (DUF1080)/FG-GAP-like repeat
MSIRRFALFSVSAILLLIASRAFALGPTFKADTVFTGSNLNGWHTLGNADWNAQQGVITAHATDGLEGWLMLDQSLSDVGLYADIHCDGPCQAGVLLRAHKTGDGWAGILVSVSPGDLGSYEVTLDATGKILSRQKLESSKSEGGLASPMGANLSPDAAAMMKSGQIRPLPLPTDIHFPDLQPPSSNYQPGAWNGINIILYQDMIDPGLDGGGFDATTGGLVRSAAPFVADGHGPVALYAGGQGRVEFKNIQYRDLDVLKIPQEQLALKFSERHLNGFYYSWGATIADINHDGIPDVIAGPYYYLGPDYTEAHEIYTPASYNPGSEYPQISMVDLSYDFTGDGWPDVLEMSGQAGVGTATLYVNPRGESRHWKSYVVVKPVGNEVTLLADIDGDGKPELIHSGNQCLQYSKPDPKDPTERWITKTVSAPGPWGSYIGHGIGIGDINGDGRMDFVTAYGWFEQPPAGSSQTVWTYHPEAFGRWGHTQGGAGGAEIGVFDVNGDGLPDVVTSLEGHGYGLAWYEQKHDQSGKISFVKHTIMDNFLTKNAGGVIFTEPHATAFADMDGDGIPDLITGKRAMSHLFDYGDPDPMDAPVLYVYLVKHNPKADGGAEFVPTLVHNMSGVGSQIALKDLNGDGRPDIVTSGIFGTFVFFNHMSH